MELLCFQWVIDKANSAEHNRLVVAPLLGE